MDAKILEIGTLVLTAAWLFSPVAVITVLISVMNRRDRRQARLHSLVARHFPNEVVRSDIVIEARCAMLTRNAVIRVDVRHDGGEVWPAIERLHQALPPVVRLVVTGVPATDHSRHQSWGASSEVRVKVSPAARVA